MIHVYTGNGKGKTTAAVGQGVRACGAGLRVYMIQFLKGSTSSELNILNELENFSVFKFEKKRDFIWNLTENEKLEVKKEIKEGIEFVASVLVNNKCDVLILDEIMGVLSNDFISVNELLELLSKKGEIEIILTGRNVPKEIVEKADLVTEMKMIKHYYEKGVNARKGIEF